MNCDVIIDPETFAQNAKCGRNRSDVSFQGSGVALSPLLGLTQCKYVASSYDLTSICTIIIARDVLFYNLKRYSAGV